MKFFLPGMAVTAYKKVVPTCLHFGRCSKFPSHSLNDSFHLSNSVSLFSFSDWLDLDHLDESLEVSLGEITIPILKPVKSANGCGHGAKGSSQDIF